MSERTSSEPVLGNLNWRDREDEQVDLEEDEQVKLEEDDEQVQEKVESEDKSNLHKNREMFKTKKIQETRKKSKKIPKDQGLKTEKPR